MKKELKKLQNISQDQVGRLVLKKAQELDNNWDLPEKRNLIIADILSMLSLLSEYPHIQKLSIILQNAQNRQAFWSFLVPLEREFSLKNITDCDIIINENDKEISSEKIKATAILDNIRSAMNIGNIFRTAECFSFEEIILCGYTSSPENSKISKSSMGTHDMVKWRYNEQISDTIHALKNRGYTIYALETVTKSKKINNVKWKFPMAVILGNERFGIEKKTLSIVDEIIHIPLSGSKNSLNVSNAFAITAFEISKSNPQFFG